MPDDKITEHDSIVLFENVRKLLYEMDVEFCIAAFRAGAISTTQLVAAYIATINGEFDALLIKKVADKTVRTGLINAADASAICDELGV